jgi:hypothetical protein
MCEFQELREANAELAKALKALLKRDEKNTCQHENTYRGGLLWEVCADCGMRWADERGGKPAWEDPPEWSQAYDALAKYDASEGRGIEVGSVKDKEKITNLKYKELLYVLQKARQCVQVANEDAEATFDDTRDAAQFMLMEETQELMDKIDAISEGLLNP